LSDVLADAGPIRGPSAGRATVARALAIVGGIFYAQVLVLVTMPVAARQAGVSPPVVGLLLAIPGAISLALDVPVAALSDGRSRRLFLLVGGLLLALGGLILAGAGSAMPVWAGGVATAYVAMALLVAPALALLTEHAPASRRSFLQGVNGSIQAVASVSAAIVAGLLLSASLAPLAFLTVSAAGLAIVFLAGTLVSEPPRSTARAASTLLGSYRRALGLLRQPLVALAGVLAIAYGVLFLVVGNAFMPTFLIGLGISPAIAGLLLAGRTGVVALTSASFGRAVARRGAIKPVVALTLIGALGAAAVPLAVVAQPILVLVVILQGLGIAYSVPAANVWITTGTQPESRAIAIAATNIGSRVVLLVMAPLLAATAVSLPSLPFLLGSLCLAGCAAAMLWIHRAVPDERRDEGGA
jgi:MFS family permease